MSEQSGWVQRELSGEGSPARSNAQLRHLIVHGATGLDVIGDSAFDQALDRVTHGAPPQGVATAGVHDDDVGPGLNLICKISYQ